MILRLQLKVTTQGPGAEFVWKPVRIHPFLQNDTRGTQDIHCRLQLAKSILKSTLAVLSHILATRRHESLRNGRMAGTARVAHHRDARSALGAVRVSRSAAEQAVSLSHGTAVESTTGSARSLEPQKPEKPSCRTECSSNDSHYDGKTSERLKSASQFTRIETAPEDRSFES